MANNSSKLILIIQTAFIGDTILASHFARKIAERYPDHKIHFFLRGGNEAVIQGLPYIEKVWIWNKKERKFYHLIQSIFELRKFKFDMVFNLHRHFNSGFVAALMRSSVKIGFRQNPMSFFYTQKVNHEIPDSRGYHEVQRNLTLISNFPIEKNPKNYKPELPLTDKNFKKIAPYIHNSYFVVAPASVWFTKAWGKEKFRLLARDLSSEGIVYLIGAPGDFELCERIRKDIPNTKNLCGKLDLLDSGALMQSARRVFVNDSAPLHLASCVNAKTTAIFCSTTENFGYGPLSDNSVVVDIGEALPCRPCGLHGHKKCPLDHFKCSEELDVKKVFSTIFL